MTWKAGAQVKAYAYGHLLHSVYRGMVLRDLNLKDSTLEQFVAGNEAAADEENVLLAYDLNEAAVEIDKISASFQSLIPQTPLQAEVARNMSNKDAADRPEKGTPAFNVFGWWSAQEKIFPLMSKAAKKYLAFQATSVHLGCALFLP